jgi:hypothetical protein
VTHDHPSPLGPLLLALTLGAAACGPALPAPTTGPSGPPDGGPPPATQPASRPATQPASRPATQPASAPVCRTWLVDYALVGGTALKIVDTPYGAGDGTYPIGPGTARLCFTDGGGAPAPGPAALVELQVATRFALNTTAMGFRMRIVTDAVTAISTEDGGFVARGTYAGARISWSERARGYRSTGTMHCAGVLCGKFGSPPKGRSRLATGPHTIRLRPFQLGDGVGRFSMGYAEVDHSSKPSRSVLMRLEARETARRCVPTPTCD